MKKLLATLAIAAAMTQISSAGVSINFNLGTMYADQTATTTFAPGGLINLLAITNGMTWDALPASLGYSTLNEVFASVTSGFAPAGTMLVGQIGSDDLLPGFTGGNYTFYYSGAFQPGVELLTVGYSSLTLGSTDAGNGTLGFFFRSAIAIDGSDIGWIAPADGGTFMMAATTADLGGSIANNALTSGNGAQGGNGFTTVPEPSTYALIGMSALGFGGYVFRRRNRK